MKKIIYIVLFLLLSTSLYSTETLYGKVVKVTDGDSFTLLTKEKVQIKIRFDGIDCPEMGQDYGRKAKDFVANLIAGKNVRVKKTGTDRYKRILGVVYVGSVNVNEALLKNGLAWRYKYNKSEHYLNLEGQARKKKLNIWSMKNPLAPWDFRKAKQKKKK